MRRRRLGPRRARPADGSPGRVGSEAEGRRPPPERGSHREERSTGRRPQLDPVGGPSPTPHQPRFRRPSPFKSASAAQTVLSPHHRRPSHGQPSPSIHPRPRPRSRPQTSRPPREAGSADRQRSHPQPPRRRISLPPTWNLCHQFHLYSKRSPRPRRPRIRRRCRSCPPLSACPSERVARRPRPRGPSPQALEYLQHGQRQMRERATRLGLWRGTG